MAVLEVSNITKRFGKTEVLKGIDFFLEKGQVLSIIGSSGSGKTTLLRCLNSLEFADTGVISVNGETIFDGAVKTARSDEELRKRRLHFGLVFQSFNLFPQ
ncbi:MAG: amino acid ABC transporter ATP-binding protein, partial [Clostridia bacterium]|nr:amino acid ABC transporter ATP-binding protein [Clostridia bacterium]